ncbi:MAG: hypothetical protein KatS3mg091_849 [Patescibacteria group bacterium]|nr:MAG: hypothetical protein KatS3mg090_0982 [Patescibacteria group bacterium]GIW63737.1 MAG: hypothetical protein KatS3mg091_539 [Patescibacteria group bacterium]GIW64047.1 MAG: hypothetical protein KatS3mg091_849 [Patescibacteria group bacterium]
MKDLSLELIAKKLKESFKKEQNQNYAYLSAFFIVFSFFVLFIIRPTLTIAFELRDKRDSLLKEAARLNLIINNITNINIQSEKYRDDFDLLDQAVPDKMNVFSVFNQINEVFKKHNIKIVSAEASNIVLVGSDNENSKETTEDSSLREITFVYQLTGSFANFLQAIEELRTQRRIKDIANFTITKEYEEDSLYLPLLGQATDSAELAQDTVSITVGVKSFFR